MATTVSFFGGSDPDSFPAGFMLSPEERLLDAIEEGCYPRAYAILRSLDRPLSGDRAVSCLVHCFNRTLKLFRAVLEHLSPEARCGTINADHDDGFIRVEGTLLVLAAALGGPGHVEALLERGFDPNAAGPDSARLHRNTFFYRGLGAELPFGPNYRRCAAPGNSVSVRTPAAAGSYERMVSIFGCTPLAAALAAGNFLTADVLLRTPGVWKSESSAVCRAAALHAEGMGFQPGWCIPWDVLPVDCRPNEVSPTLHVDLRATLPRDENMQPGSFADFCSPELLETQYRSGLCTAADARAVLAVLDRVAVPYGKHRPRPHMGKGPDMDAVIAKLLLTARYFPKVCREPEMCDVFLRIWLAAQTAEKAPTLLKVWQKLAGPDRDVSHAAYLLFRQRGEKLRACLEALAEGGSLCLSADAEHPDSIAELREILRRVRIVPSPLRSGISAFARGVMELSPDVRLLKKLFTEGPLAYEPKESLLRAAGVRSRPVILTAEFREPEETYPLERTSLHFYHYADARGGDQLPLAKAMFSGDLGEADCMAYLLDPHAPGICGSIWGLVQGMMPERLCAAENPNAMRAWIRLDPEFPWGSLRSDLRTEIGEEALEHLGGTPLAHAVAAGRTENVRTLLAAGAEPDPCCSAVFADAALACTPLLLALFFDREDAARALLDAGARCDLSRGAAYAFFRRMPEAGRALAARLGGLGLAGALAREAGGAA